MSSIEPNDGGGEVNSGEEVAGGLVVAGGDSPVWLEFSEKILDQVSGFIKFRLIRARLFPVLFWRNDHHLSGW